MSTIKPIEFKFINAFQERYFYETKRNQGFSGGFGNGKTMGASMKGLALLTTFPKYRIAGTRYTSKDLQTSTMSTFFKLCPPELYSDAYGGRRADKEGYLRLINGSEVFWLHLDDYSEESLRGLEVNSRLGDQDEEIAENIYLIMDVRMERWDQAEIPPHLNPEHFPKNPFSGRPMPPCYNMSLVNPDTTVHWWYRRYHPDSPESYQYTDTHSFISASIHDNPAVPQSLKDQMLSRDKAWVDKYYWGKWGIAGGSIHYIDSQSILEYTPADLVVHKSRGTTPVGEADIQKLLEVIRRDGIKYRVMDHGEAAPTTCLWFAYLSPTCLNRNYGILSKGIHVCYREYYMPERLVSYHREAIAALSGDEKYYGNYADPAIFKKNQQKYGGYWTTADEYLDHRIAAPAIMWTPADNNEMATRNAVGEMLALDPRIINPITGQTPAPAMYFLKKDQAKNSQGCSHVITQTQSARHKKIGSLNGTVIYSDERDPNIDDHAYDPLRYYSIMPKTNELPETPLEVPQFSFAKHLEKRRMNRFRQFGGSIYGR
jgi:hypothetical protein